VLQSDPTSLHQFPVYGRYPRMPGEPATNHPTFNVVLATALPAAFRKWGDLFDVVVLLYPRTLGTFDPAAAEYVVLVNAGWLE
jgi:hypothetical protein